MLEGVSASDYTGILLRMTQLRHNGGRAPQASEDPAHGPLLHLPQAELHSQARRGYKKPGLWPAGKTTHWVFLT